MASNRQQLEDALVAAHTDGDEEGARVIADEIKSLTATKPVTAAERFGAVPTGMNNWAGNIIGLPVDTGLNVVDLITAGLGYAASKFNNGVPPDTLSPVDRSKVFGSSQQIKGMMDKSNLTTTQMPRPDDSLSQYIYTAASAAPGAALMQPSTMGQGMAAVTANVTPALAGKAAGDMFPEHATEANLLANALTTAAVGKAFTPNKQTDTRRLDTLKESQKEGYRVPPSTTNPTVTNRILESIGGKVGTQQDAAVRNAEVTNSLTRKALGLTDDALLTRDTLKTLRGKAGKNYDAVRNVGTIQADAKYSQALDDIASSGDKAGKAFPGLVGEEIKQLVTSMKQPAFDADAAIEATQILRDKADGFYAKGDKDLGRAYKAVSNELENMVERSLPKGSKILENFKEARKDIAKTYSVEGALNDATGNVNALKLARQLEKGKPLSPELKTAAKFGQAFPKAAQPINDSGSVRNTDVIVGAGTAAMSKEPSLLAYPFSRMAVRDLLLSKAGQRLAMPKQKAPQNLSPEDLRLYLLLNQMQSQAGSEAR